MENLKVMLVEDEELIREGLKNILDWDALGFTVSYSASNGAEALELLASNPVDIIVTDINMPIMDGLRFLAEFRKTDTRARCIILTGYDEFDYARRAVSLDVEDYILKPIDEEQLEDVLLQAAQKLSDMDKKSMTNGDDKTGWLSLLKGKLDQEESKSYLDVLPTISDGTKVRLALMFIALESLGDWKLSDVLLQFKNENTDCRAVYLAPDTLLLLHYSSESGEANALSTLETLQDTIESQMGIRTFICLGKEITSYDALCISYETALKLKRYLLIKGYGSCVTEQQIQERQSSDMDMDQDHLRKLLLKKDTEGCRYYIEDLFINNVKQEMPLDDIYHISLKTALFLMEIKQEYRLTEKGSLKNLTDLVDSIYQAEDMATLKTVFIQELCDMIQVLNENDSQYTPVVKQILNEVHQKFREDMNLKTLSYKYHMNASYLGQIFQKEVGCSFAQYLSNFKNSKAKELLLNSNMKIIDIAQEVGYQDTSYFYRKFKQCYGVSPAAMREMKKY